MDVEAGTTNALRDFDSKNNSRRNMIIAGVAIGTLVAGGVAVGVYFGTRPSSSNNDATTPSSSSQFAKGYISNQAFVSTLPVFEAFSTATLASSQDWRTVANVVTPIKNQGQCGDCWAFAAAEAMESAFGVAGGTQYNYAAYKSTDPYGGNVVGFSAMQFSACDSEFASQGAGGCNGGDAPSTINNYLGGKGLALAAASDYPYFLTSDSQSGNAPACNSAAVTQATTYAKSGTTNRGLAPGKNAAVTIAKNENSLMTALANGPISIAVDASNWNSYSGGIVVPGGSSASGFSKITCSTDGQTMDHAVQLVGYSQSGNYWIVRNQWGTSWGENGYIRLQMGTNTCNLWSEAIQVVLPAGLVTPSATTTKPAGTQPVLVTTTKVASTTQPGATTGKVATTAAAIVIVPTTPIPTTVSPPTVPSGAVYSTCDLNSITAATETTPCYSATATLSEFSCTTKTDATSQYLCCYAGVGWGGTITIKGYKSNGYYTGYTCNYAPKSGQPQYPALPSGSSGSGSVVISASCIATDFFGSAIAYYLGGQCYDTSGNVDTTGACQNPSNSPLCDTRIGSVGYCYAAPNAGGAGC